MDRITVTEEQVTASIEKVVAEKGDGYVYVPHPDDTVEYVAEDGSIAVDEDCLYVWDDQPDCIVAHVAVDLGVSVSDLAPHEGNSALSVLPKLFHMPDHVVAAMGKAQEKQDKKYPYGEVLVGYKNKIAEHHQNERKGM